MKAKNSLLYIALAGVALGFTPKPEPSLKEAFKKDFYIGAALNYRQLSGQDAKATSLIKQPFNTISP